jgi:hypothetical protein
VVVVEYVSAGTPAGEVFEYGTFEVVGGALLVFEAAQDGQGSDVGAGTSARTGREWFRRIRRPGQCGGFAAVRMNSRRRDNRRGRDGGNWGRSIEAGEQVALLIPSWECCTAVPFRGCLEPHTDLLRDGTVTV